LKVKQTLTSNS